MVYCMPHALIYSLFAVYLIGGLSVAQAACPANPADEYERVYCEIKVKGGGAMLPSFEDFRRNEPKVQALLLKRPASRLGIDLPKPAQQAAKSDEVATNAVRETEAPKPENSPVNGTLSECDLEGATIQCPGQRYLLATNQRNSALANGVLGSSNKLGLEPFTGDLNDEAAVRAYLSNAYDRYIAKMLDIGLGGATMSFTRFYNSFRRHEAEGVDFAGRMESTYSYLKQDKRNMAVSERLTEELPERLQQCVWAGHAVIVCDDVATNWVYVQVD